MATILAPQVKTTSELLFGTDPELVAVYKKLVNGVEQNFTLPPYFFRKQLGVNADMTEPRHPVFLAGDGWKFHEDGAAFEMSVRPSHDPRELFEMIQEVVNRASNEIISQFPEYCEPRLQFLPTVGFEVERWLNEGKDFDLATRFGCDPDRDAFNHNALSPEVDAKLWPYRYTGGHIHISGSPLFMEDPILAIQCQALVTGCAAILSSDVPELDHQRTYMYGRPGKYRVQNYGKGNPFGDAYRIGIEYRTPSSRWASSWERAQMVFSWVPVGVYLLETGLGAELIKELEKDVTTAVLSADQELAASILNYILTKI